MDYTSRMVALLRELRRERNGAVADSMRYYGTPYGLNYGVSLPTLLDFSKIQIGGNDMAYNKAKEEKKWRLWKEAEEKQLRSLGVSEDTIEQLRVHDWAIFNSDRRYYQRMQEAGTYLDEVAEDTTPPEIKTVEDFLDNIENQQLYQVLIKVDRLTLQAVLLQLQGFSIAEIALMLDMKEYTVYKRLSRLKEKIKKLLG